MIDRRMKFRHIQCFVEIANERSFKRAAANLFLSQTAISKTLKELEDILDHRLFTRDRGGVELTAEGDTFLRFAKSSIANLQQGIDGISSHQARLDHLSVGVLPSVAARFVPTVVDRFAALAPNAVLRILDGPHGYLLERLKLGELDLIIGRMGPHTEMKGLSFTALYRERIAFVVRAGHPLLDNPVLDEIVNWPIVYPSDSAVIRPIVDRFLLEHAIGDLPRRIETVSGAFGRIYVQNSDAVWIISEGVVANEIENGVLARLPFNMDTTLGPIGVLEREDWDRPETARQFRQALREAADQTAEA